MDIGAITRDSNHMRYPASLAQTRFWLLDALDPGSSALNVAVRWTLLGHLTPEQVGAAWQRVIDRHEILRTSLIHVDGVPMQAVRSTLPFHVTHHDLSDMPDAERMAIADRLGEEEARKPFVLEAAPLMRVTFIILQPGVSRLLVTVHHAVCDGWSIGVLANEFLVALGDRPLPELAMQYGDYAEWQQAWLTSPALDQATQYWTDKLAALPYVTVRPDHAAEQRGDGAIASVLLPRSLTDEVAANAVRHGCTPFAIAFAALGRVLQSRTGADDIAIGTQVAGRPDVDLEAMVGCFINTLVLRLDLSGAPSWDCLIDRAAAVVGEALEHEAMPFEILTRTLNPKRERGRTPLFSVNLIFQRSFVSPPPSNGITLVDMPSHSAGALYDLNFFMVERPDGWRASCEYDTAMFKVSTIEAMLADWTTALAGDAIPTGPIDSKLEQLAAIWREVLGVSIVTAEDGFFDLGGHSLLAARMLSRIESVFGRRIGMAALFTDPTLAGLARHLEDDPATNDGIVVLNEGGSRTPIVAVGTPETWRGLSRAIGPNFPYTCLTQPSAKAAAALDLTGAVAVMGTGSGGGAALDLAHSLQAKGRRVTLVLVDAAPPARPRLWSRLRRLKAGTGFDGRTLLFHRGPSNVPAADWAEHVSGKIDVLAMPATGWESAVADQIIATLA